MAIRTSRSSPGSARPAAEKVEAARGRPSSSRETINILLLEDNPADADLIRHALRIGEIPFQLAWVDSRAAFVQHLARSPPDLILSDFALPSFDGYSALQIV